VAIEYQTSSFPTILNAEGVDIFPKAHDHCIISLKKSVSGDIKAFLVFINIRKINNTFLIYTVRFLKCEFNQDFIIRNEM